MIDGYRQPYTHRIEFVFLIGVWMDSGHGDTRMVDLEVEEAEDVAGDPSIGPDSPTLLRASSKSQTKT